MKESLSKAMKLPVESDFDEYLSKVASLVDRYKDVSGIQDSISDDEIKSKLVLTEAIETHNLINESSSVVIWGCWYGSILVPYFANRVHQVVGIDKNDDVIKFAKNKLFQELGNVTLITDDVFSKHRNVYLEAGLIVNTACDHMRPMKDWEWFKHGALETDIDYPGKVSDRDPSKKRIFKTPKLSTECHFAFQSSNTVGFGGGPNAVRSMDEFKDQLPRRAEIWFENETPMENGVKFTLIGKFK